MRGGASQHALKERKNDLYETPECATLALMRVADLPKKIWEPCAGRGAISRVLRDAGHEVIAQDIVSHENADPYIIPRIDFLMEAKAPDGVACIVTNPPYKLSNEFIRHSLSLVPRAFFLLRFLSAEGVERSDIIDHHLRQIWLGRERLPPMHRDGWEGKKTKSPPIVYAWFEFVAEDQNGKSSFSRLSWRG